MSNPAPEDPLVPYKRFVCQVGRRLGVDSKTIGKKKGEKIDKMLNRVIEALDAKLAAPAKIIDNLMKEHEASKERDEREAKEHLAFHRQQAAQDQEKGLPPLPSGWSLAKEVAHHAGPAASSLVERQARRAEFAGRSAMAYSLYVALYASSEEPRHLLSAARIRLRSLGDPHLAVALLTAATENADAQLKAAAASLLSEARKAAAGDRAQR